MQKRLLAIAIFLMGGLLGCVQTLWTLPASYDSRKLTIQALSLFNQRQQPLLATNDWKGDWVLRRERLALIDQSLRSVKPDLVIMQEIMRRQDSMYDADQHILGAGALLGYQWQVTETISYDDRQEVEAMAIVTGLPLRADPLEGERKTMWQLGEDSHLSAFIASMEGQDLAIFNLKLSENLAQQGVWYTFIKERIAGFLQEKGLCHKRMILAGIFAGQNRQSDYQELVEGLQLTDTSRSYCEPESQCFTATTDNDLYAAIKGDTLPERNVRILTHRSALVYASSRNLLEAREKNAYAERYGLKRLPASHYYGWLASVRFARCSLDDRL